MKNRPAGYAPAGFQPSSIRGSTGQDFTLRQALGAWQWYGLWLTLFLNSTAGIAVISPASPLAQENFPLRALTAGVFVRSLPRAHRGGRRLVAWARAPI